VAAVTVAAALLLGGRLHDDFNGANKNIYVENFADEPILARIRLAAAEIHHGKDARSVL